MTEKEQRKAAKEFAENWKGKGDEKGESQKFWLSLLRDVYGVDHPENYIEFEDRVMLDHTSFIDGYIPETKILIEQKAIGKNLRAAIKQSDGSMLTPFQQAKRYVTELPVDQHPNFIITSNFESFLVYDMHNPQGEPEEIFLKDLERDYYRLSFLVKTNSVHLQQEMELSIKAGEIVGLIYDELLKQYKDPENTDSLKSLNMLCVRLVFCLYAEDSELFNRNAFRDYLTRFEAKDIRRAIIELFKVLDTEEDKRDPYLEEELAIFPYVNGGLFAEENIEIPQFTEELKTLLLTKASDFNWSEISPTIFGAVFESTLNPETRRSGGMHYTSIENIHKVIDPLFLDDLRNELTEIKNLKTEKIRKDKIYAFQDKLSKLKFLDPACGSGNFLTETYISLRRLENEALDALYKGQIQLGIEGVNPIKVSISQFYGIEINDFAVTVGKTALWIAESQMMKETEDIVHMTLDFLPLKTNAYIHEGNALRIDWNDIVDKSELNYIMGNPPFVGTKMMNNQQKNDTKQTLGSWKNYGTLDFVACWYAKAAEYIFCTNIRCAFVSTNSIVQGEQVSPLWKPLLEDKKIHIDFAYRTFQWDSEATLKAKVHCVIIGFSQAPPHYPLKIFDRSIVSIAKNINPYLVNGENIYVEAQKKPLSKTAPQMFIGCEMKDDGYYTLSEEEKNEIIRSNNGIEKFIHPYYMGKDMISRKPRYCFWLKNANPNDVRKYPELINRIKNVKQFRLECPSPDTNRYAEYPMLPVRLRYYSEDRNTDALAIPKVSSQNRKYIPMDVISSDAIAGSKLFLIPMADLYTFGILTSNVHMAWVRTVCGRLKSDYSYSSNVVYNTFAWCNPTQDQKELIEKTAQAILDARALYPESSLADLYDDLTMPTELRKAHQQNDMAVMKAYGFTKVGADGKNHWLTESEVVAELMKMYQELTTNKEG